ncbi:HIT domain-containing protein [Pseudomonas sp. RIT-PI-AD]|uniref:HIT domain-containing protein n=1 Tax=Pseudomonas sp. RIT-PI-AD TaxID=3035294 RepID=UPI0021D862EB|nr:HIT domain-containing protein [Pseudomonas sp. RIT-PI-AD]
MADHLIFATAHWHVSHRRDARYPGYLIVAARAAVTELHALPADALQALGPVLQRTERLLRRVYAPRKVIVYKLGFSTGFSVHFHVAPVTEGLLADIAAHPAYADEPDGNDVILFLSREYAERPLDAEETERMRREIEKLKHAIGEVQPMPGA